MKKLFAFLFFASLTWAGSNTPQSGKLGIGLGLGSSTGLKVKYWLGGQDALDFGLGGKYYGRFSRWDGEFIDDRCYGSSFYNSNRGYCNDQRWDRYYRGDRGRWNIFSMHATYLRHNFRIIRASIPMPIFYGGGLQLDSWQRNFYADEDLWMGLRGVIGLSLMPKTIPFDFYFELAPVLWVYPDLDLEPEAGIGARLWF